MKRILFQGDSITDANRGRENDNLRGSGYPTMVGGKLGFDCPNEYEFLNRGIGGNRVVDLLARVKADIINLKPDIMSILIGVNDVWHELSFQNGVGTESYEKIYNLLIDEICAALPEIKLIILEPFVLKGTATEEQWETFRFEVEQRAAAAKRVAEGHGLPFVELQKKFDDAEKLAPASYWLIDGVHPTAAGHELISREWIAAFKKL